jgi:acyl-coenzyme A synthetase/AMP-(fatty) acid ligase
LKQRGKQLALIEAADGRSFTFQQLNDEIHQLSGALSGFSRGLRIAFCLPNGARWISFFLALQKRGLVAVPLDAGLPEEACVGAAKHLRCHALFYHGKLHVFSDAAPASRVISCIKVTSGTSAGLPKTVLCRAEHLQADGANLIRTMGIRPKDMNLATIPLGHSYGLGNLVLPLILQGTAIVCAAQFVPRQIIDWLDRYRVTVYPSVPAIFRVLAALPGEFRLSNVRLVISAGAPLTSEVARAFYQRYRLKIHNFYGSSETGGICYDKTGAATLQGRSVGKPVAGVSISVKKGTIRVKSKAVAKRKGIWRMPDRGDWNERGELVLLGRRGREVNIGGKKVHPSEVEQALRSVVGVSDVIVWEGKDLQRSFLQAAVETELALKEIQDALSARLPDWKLPKHYLLTVELPRSERGKIDLSALRRDLQAQLR